MDDADDASVHVMYDDEEEGWVTLPSKKLMILRPHEQDTVDEDPRYARSIMSLLIRWSLFLTFFCGFQRRFARVWWCC